MYIHTVTNKNSITKIRFVENRSSQMVLRVDEHDHCERINNSLLKGLAKNKFKNPPFGFDSRKEDYYDAIIISDYNKGFLEEEDIQYICENNKNVFVDTKKKLGEWIKDADYIKINELEYKKNHELLSDKGFEEKLIVTLGSKGCRYKEKEFPVKEVPVKDVSGAGDTFIAGLVRGYLDTQDIESAIEFAQECTTRVVQKHGVATVTLKEIQNG
jgi:bifunctional ADP-heptose synthase (sugar kinase/adenylyltransferase)